MADILSSFDKVVDSYSKRLKDMVTEVTDSAQNLVKYEGLGLDELSELLDPGSVSEAINDASMVMDALGDNPLIAKMGQMLEDQFGISVRGPLQLAQTMVNGGNSGLLQVALAMLNFPIKSSAFITTINDVLDTVTTLSNTLNSPGMTDALDTIVNPYSDITIPISTTSKLNNARILIAESLMYPFQDLKYVQGMAMVKEAAAELDDLPMLGATINPATGAMIASVFDSAYIQFKSLYDVSTTSGNELITLVAIIRDTDITKKPTDTRFAQARKALSKLSALNGQMRDVTQQQRVQIPSYLLGLTVIYNFLQVSKPAEDAPPVSLAQSTVNVSASSIENINKLIGKLIIFSKTPYKVSALPDFVSELTVAIEAAVLEITNAQAAIDLLWLAIPEIKTLVESITALLDGLDYAQDIISVGDIAGFSELSEITATSEGAAVAMCIELGQTAMDYNLFGLADYAKDMKAKLEKDSEDKSFKQDAKKDKRAAKLKTKLLAVNQKIDELSTLVAYATTGISVIKNAVT